MIDDSRLRACTHIAKKATLGITDKEHTISKLSHLVG